MEIKQVTIGPFKKYEEPVTHTFGRTNGLYGTNDVGKTTEAEAICWCLYGSDLGGSNRELEKLFNRSQVARFRTVPAGLERQWTEWDATQEGNYVDRLEAFRKKYDLSGEQPTIEVMCTIQLESSEHLISRRRTYKGMQTTHLNGTVVSQAGLDEVLPPKDLFYSVFVSGYFLGVLDKKDQRNLIANHLPAVDWQSLLGTEIPQGYDMSSAQAFLKSIEQTKQRLTVELGKYKAYISMADEEIPKIDTGEVSCSATLTDTLKEMRSRGKAISAAQVHLSNAIRASQEAVQYNKNVVMRRAAITKELKTLESNKAECPGCGYDISPLVFDTESKRKQFIAEYRSLTPVVETSKLRFPQDIASKIGMEELEFGEQTKLHELQKGNDDAIDSLTYTLQKAAAAKVNAARLEELIRHRTETVSRSIRTEGLIAHVEGLRMTARRLPMMVLEQQIATIGSHLPSVQLKLYRELRSGEMEPDLQFLYDGVPYGVLSNSSRIKAGLEVSVMLNILSGADIPVFVDNAESVVQLPVAMERQQCFVAYVNPQMEELNIVSRED